MLHSALTNYMCLCCLAQHGQLEHRTFGVTADRMLFIIEARVTRSFMPAADMALTH